MDETTKAADEAQPTSSDYLSEVSFADLPLSEPMQRAIEARGYRHPTPVQSQAIPEILEGRDLIVRSKTGTGKTAAFSIPIVERIPKGARKPLALVLCPTRELALQVSQELEALSKGQDLRVAAIYGGASMREQVRALEEGAEIVVGTPGRVYDHIRRRTLKLDEAQIAVLDEADEMLSMGFFEEVTRILDKLPKERQTLLFSATLSPDIERLISKYLVGGWDRAPLLRRGGGLSPASKPALSPRAGAPGIGDHLRQHPRRRLAFECGAQPERLRRRRTFR